MARGTRENQCAWGFRRNFEHCPGEEGPGSAEPTWWATLSGFVMDEKRFFLRVIIGLFCFFRGHYRTFLCPMIHDMRPTGGRACLPFPGWPTSDSDRMRTLDNYADPRLKWLLFDMGPSRGTRLAGGVPSAQTAHASAPPARDRPAPPPGPR